MADSSLVIPQSRVARPVSFWAPFWAFVAFFPLALINVVQTLSLVLAPVSRALFFRVNIFCGVSLWSWWSVIIERIHGMRLEIEGDELPRGESAIVFANHQSMTDVVVLLCLARRTRRMAEMRWMVKGSMRYVPFLGWGMLGLDFLFLERDWAKDRAHVTKAFERFRAKASPVWLVLFPEGTRRAPEKHKASMRRAKRAAVPETKNVMFPRTKGFTASLQGLEGKVTAVYTITIAYPGGAPTLYEMFDGQVACTRMRVKRTLVSELPQDEPGRASWLVQQFQTIDGELAGPLGAV